MFRIWIWWSHFIVCLCRRICNPIFFCDGVSLKPTFLFTLFSRLPFSSVCLVIDLVSVFSFYEIRLTVVDRFSLIYCRFGRFPNWFMANWVRKKNKERHQRDNEAKKVVLLADIKTGIFAGVQVEKCASTARCTIPTTKPKSKQSIKKQNLCKFI